jgi:hypothetical protein
MTLLPIVERELRVAARRPATHRARLLVALAGMLILLSLVGLRGAGTSAFNLGKTVFLGLGVLGLIYSLMAGVFLTADCLSEEKREGTLGLLFLADLSPLDVLLGKLAATSLHGLSGLLVCLPMLALPLVFGGVTGAELGRLGVVLLATLFFSLSAGLLASTLSQETHRTMLGTLMAMLFFTGLCPAMFWVGLSGVVPAMVGKLLLLASPAYAFAISSNSFFALRSGGEMYWESVGMIVLMGAGFLFLASRTMITGGRWERWLAGASQLPQGRRSKPALAASVSQALRRQNMLAVNPVMWLARRDRSPSRLAWLVAALMLPAVLAFTGALIWKLDTSRWLIKWLIIGLFLAYLAHQLLKLLVALEAVRQFSEDRRNGNLELLLVSPLTESEILTGQRMALIRCFYRPVLFMIFCNLVLFLFVLLRAKSLSMDGPDNYCFLVFFGGGAGVLGLDCWAISRTGMWFALRSITRYRAASAVLCRILLPSWLSLTLVIFLSVVNNGNPFRLNLIAFWFGVGVVVDLYFGWAANRKFLQGLRAAMREPGRGET